MQASGASDDDASGNMTGLAGLAAAAVHTAANAISHLATATPARSITIRPRSAPVPRKSAGEAPFARSGGTLEWKAIDTPTGV